MAFQEEGIQVQKIKRVYALFLVAIAANTYAYDDALVRDGRATSCIILPDNAGPVEKHAADELAIFIEKATGARLAIRNAPSTDLYNIRLGTVEAKNLLRSDAVNQAVARLQDDGFVLAADKEGLRVISKKPVGVLYGVYAILKKYAGIRWFAPGDDFEFCPKQATIAVPEQITVSNPSFKVRRWGFVCANWNSKTIDSWDWLVRNGMTVGAEKSLYKSALRDELEKRGAAVGNSHNFGSLISDDLFDEHPEYFPLIDGKRRKQRVKGDNRWPQPCTSNPKVAEIMIAAINKDLDLPPKENKYLIGNNDDILWCQCADCVKLDPPDEKKKEYVSTRYYTLINKLAGEVLKTHPDVDLWAWAYQNFQYPPAGVVPDPRLYIEACIHGRCYRHSMADIQCQANDKFRDMLGQWCKLKNPVSTLEYLDATIFPVYLPIEKTFAEDIKYYKKIGLAGCRIFTVPPDGDFGARWRLPCYRDSMPALWQTYYLAAQLFWDADADYAALYEDMGSKYYGKAWPIMREYRALLTQSFLETSGHVCYGMPQYAVGKCLEKAGTEESLVQLLDEAEKNAGPDRGTLKKIMREREYFQNYWQFARKVFLAKRQKDVYADMRSANIVIDGKLGEADWERADVTSGFVMADGRTMAEPQTFVRIVYDDDNIYFGVEAMENDPGKMKIKAGEHDGAVYGDSSLEFFIAAPGVEDKYAHLIVNPMGVTYDALAFSGNSADIKFNSQAEIKTATLKDRWIAEIRFPAAAFGLKINTGETWKINVARNRRLIDKMVQGSSWCNGIFHGPEAFRPVVFGLLKNGDFEEALALTAAQKKETWTYLDNRMAKNWVVNEGNPGASSLLGTGAARGTQFLRIKDGAIYGAINQSADYRGDLVIRAQVRGKGTVAVYIYRYNRDPVKNMPSIILKEMKADSSVWMPLEAIFKCEDDKLLKLAFHVKGEIDLDDVTIIRGPRQPVAPKL